MADFHSRGYALTGGWARWVKVDEHHDCYVARSSSNGPNLLTAALCNPLTAVFVPGVSSIGGGDDKDKDGKQPKPRTA